MRATRLVLPLAAAVPTSCGGSTAAERTEAGYEALGRQGAAAAVGHFETALEGLPGCTEALDALRGPGCIGNG